MSLNIPSRRALRTATSLTTSPAPYAFLIPCLQRRSVWWSGLLANKSQKKAPAPKNALTEEFLRKKPAASTEVPVPGSLSSSSVFADDEKPYDPQLNPTGGSANQPRSPQTMAAALDPTPAARRSWERKMVIKQVRSRGRLTKAQILKRTERELLAKSHHIKTSVKKLNPLARQISGKTIEDAIVQMRFSKKKAAKDVLEHLEHARNEAVVKRGMGLGKVTGQTLEQEVKIMTKDKKRVKVNDSTRIYVDQAWVSTGPYTQSPDHRARGQIFMMKNPTTSLSVILKEEATRLRLHKEREDKIKKRKVWVQLPNRPITAQRQHYSW